MRRREFITLLGGAAVAWPLAARGQLATKRLLIAVLNASTERSNPAFIEFFLQGMRELGRHESRDFDLVHRYAENDLARLPLIAEELVRLNPAVILAVVTACAIAAKKATATIPIVSPQMIDPVGLGLVASHARPGGNVTGILASLEGLPGKQIEILREVVPTAIRIGMLVNPDNAQNPIQAHDAQAAVATTAVTLLPVEARSAADLDSAFATIVHERVDALLVLADPMLFTERRRIAALATDARLPTIFSVREHVEAGGLVSYGINRRDSFRRAAAHVDKILRGAKPGDLPVELPTKLELVVNLKTAKAIGLAIPESFLLRADEVIE